MDGLISGEFPISLLTKWSNSPYDNGYIDWTDIEKYNDNYARLRNSEKQLLQIVGKEISTTSMPSNPHIIDLGCGDGVSLKLFLDAHMHETEKEHNNVNLMLLDNNGTAVQHARAQLHEYAHVDT